MKKALNPNQKLLFPGNDYHYNACLNYMPMDHVYIRGYNDAADELVKYVGNIKMNQDGLVYPIIFLYRQCIELLLKRIGKDYDRLENNQMKVEKQHNLLKLFNKHKKILIIFADNRKISECFNRIQKIDKVDPESMSSRYSTDLNGDQSIKINDHILNIETFAKEANAVINFLDQVNDAIERKIIQKKDLE